MKEYRVTCVEKPGDRLGRHEHITTIGNKDEGWKVTREDAIRRIESGLEAFFTLDYTTNRKVYIKVVREANKLPYLQTYADGKWHDNLLALAECGASCRLVG